MNKAANKRKVLAPLIWVIIISAGIILESLVLWWALGTEGSPLYLKILICCLPLVLVAAIITVYIERVKEIKSGIEDDLDRY